MKPHSSPTPLVRACALIAVLLACLATPMSLRAASGTWTSVAASNWGTSTSWSGNVIADGAGSTATITSNITANRTVTINSTSRTLGVLNIGDVANTSHNFTIAANGGATLSFNNSGATATLNALAGHKATTLDATLAVLLADSLNINNAGAATGNTLAINGTISSSTAGVKTLANVSTGAGAVNIGATITDGGGGTVAVAQNSATSIMSLSNSASTYTGSTSILAGTLNANTIVDAGLASSIGSSDATAGNLIIAGGALLHNAANVASTNRLFTIGGASGDTATLTSSGAAVTDILSFTNTGSLAFGNTNAHTLVIRGTNTGANAIASLIADNTGATSVTKSDAGTWSLTNAANTYTGVTSILGGTLNANKIANAGAASSIGSATNAAANLIIAGGTLLHDAANVASTNRLFTIGGTTGDTATINSSAASTTDIMTFSNSAGSIAFGNTNAHTLVIRGTNTGLNQISSLIGDNTGATALTKNDAGTWNLANAANTYTGVTSVLGGTLRVQDLNAAGTASSIGSATSAAANLVIAGGTIEHTAATVASTNRSFTIGGASGNTATLTSSAAGTSNVLSFTNSSVAIAFGNTAAHTLILNGTNTGVNSIGAVIANNTGLTSVTKDGTGRWELANIANTYTGVTSVLGGTLRFNGPLGSAAAAASNLIIAGATLEKTGNAAASMNRLFTIGGASGDNATLIASGSTTADILSFTNTGVIAFGNTNAHTLTLDGTNTGVNNITGVLNDNTGLTSIVKQGAGLWQLGGANGYSGGTTLANGTLRVSAANNLGASAAALIFDGGTLRVNGTALTSITSLDKTVTFNSGKTVGLNIETAANIFTVDQVLNQGAGGFTKSGNGTAVLNQANTYSGLTTITAGTLQADIADGVGTGALGNAGDIKFGGGSLQYTSNSSAIDYSSRIKTSLSAVIIDTNGQDVTFGSALISSNTGGLTKRGLGTLNLSVTNAYLGNTTVTAGTLKIGVNDAISTNVSTTAFTMNPTAGGNSATLDLNGKNQQLTAITATTDGNAVITNTGGAASTLTIGANDTSGTIGSLTPGATYTITNGASALSLSKIGTGTQTITSAATLSYTGTTSVSGGGTLNLGADAGGLGATTALSATNTGSNLNITALISSPGSITSVTADDGANLRFFDGTGTAISTLTSLTLGTNGKTTILGLEIGGSGSDTLTTTNAATVANTAGAISFSLASVGGLANFTDYVLLSAASGLDPQGLLNLATNYTVANGPGGFSAGSLVITDTTVSYKTGSAIVGSLYWDNTNATGSWVTTSPSTNWKDAATGGVDAGYTPGPGSTVYFGTDTSGGPAIVTTLNANVGINNLIFTTTPTGVSSVSIAPGSPAGSLTINPVNTSSADGIDVQANAGDVTISANVVSGGNQTWNVDGTGLSSLTVSGILSGAGSITKTGSGLLRLDGNNNTYAAGISIKAGTLFASTNNNSLGTAANVITLGDTVGSASASLALGNVATAFAPSIIVKSGSGSRTLGSGGTSTNNIFSGAITLEKDLTVTQSIAVNTTTTGDLTLSGGITGTGNLSVVNVATGDSTMTFSGQPTNIDGVINYSGAGSGNAVFSGGVGTKVTALNQFNTGGGQLQVTGALTVNSGGTTLTADAATADALVVSGGVNGTGNLILANNTGANNRVSVTTQAANNSGVINNVGVGTGQARIQGGVGSNVTAINQMSTTSNLAINTNAITVNSGGTALNVVAGGAALTVTSGVNGTGNLVLNNNSNTANRITLSQVAGSLIQNAGTITNSGTGAGSTLISGVIAGGASTSVIQNSATSELFLSGSNTFTGGIAIKAGTVGAGNSAAALGGAGNLITLGELASNVDATLQLNNGQTYENTPLSVVDAGSGKLTIAGSLTTGDPIFTGAITLVNHDLRIRPGADAATSADFTFTGGITGTGNLDIDYTSPTLTGRLNFQTAALNMAGTITNAGVGTGATPGVFIEGGVGTNVTGIFQNSTTSALTVRTNAVTVNSLGTTLEVGAGASSMTVAGGVNGTGNLILNNNSATDNRLTLSTNLVNNAGTITNSGIGTGAVRISGGVGSNVTAINHNSATSALTIDTNALQVNSGGTTLTNSAGGTLLTVSNGVTGTGNLVLNNNSAQANGITINSTPINNSGAIINSGNGTGNVRISGGVGSNVTAITQNSATSILNLAGSPIAVNSGGTTLTVGAGAESLAVSAASGVTGTGNLILNNNSASNNQLAINGTVAVNNTGAIINSGTGAGSVRITAGVGSNVTGINQTSATSALIIETTDISANATATTLTNAFGGAGITVNSGISGTGNLVINNNGATSNGVLFNSTINNAGTVTNSGTGAGSEVISTVIGSAVTGVIQNSATSHLEFAGTAANTYGGLTTVTAGTLSLNKTAGVNAIIGDGVSSKGTEDVLINGGTLKLLANNQLDDSVFIKLTSGTFNRNGKTETIFNFVNAGGTYNSGRGGSFTIIDPIWSAGTTDILSAESYGNLEVSGGTNTIHGDEGFALGAGSVTVGAGGLLFSGTANPTITISSDDTAAGSLILNGNVEFTGASGTAKILQGNKLTDNGDGTWTNTGGLGTFKGTVDLGAANRDFTIADGSATKDMEIGAVVANGSLTKKGAGTLELTGLNTYSGGTNVDAGTLLANSAAATGTGSVTVSGTSRIGGTGVIGLNTGSSSSNMTIGDGTNAATLFVGNPGSTSGSALSLGTGTSGSGTITLATGSFWEFNIFGAGNSATDRDTLSLFSGNAVSLAGALAINDPNALFPGLTSGTWQLLDWSGVTGGHTGAFSNYGSNLNLPTLASGYSWDWSDIYAGGTISITAVPEPGRMMLMFFGLTALFMRRRRNRK